MGFTCIVLVRLAFPSITATMATQEAMLRGYWVDSTHPAGQRVARRDAEFICFWQDGEFKLNSNAAGCWLHVHSIEINKSPSRMLAGIGTTGGGGVFYGIYKWDKDRLLISYFKNQSRVRVPRKFGAISDNESRVKLPTQFAEIPDKQVLFSLRRISVREIDPE